jgi:hypothetical protein
MAEEISIERSEGGVGIVVCRVSADFERGSEYDAQVPHLFGSAQ